MLSYAHAFVSFLFRTPGVKSENIKSVYLFGSVARGDFDENSDVDIFISVEKAHEKETLRFSEIALRNFYNSEECKKLRLLGITNPISIKYGEVRKWDLFSSIKTEGIILYSSSVSPLFKKYFLVEMKPVNDITKRNRIIRKLVGRKEAKRKEKGLVEQIGGQVLDSRHYFIPAEKISNVTRIFSKENALFEIRELWMLHKMAEDYADPTDFFRKVRDETSRKRTW